MEGLSDLFDVLGVKTSDTDSSRSDKVDLVILDQRSDLILANTL